MSTHGADASAVLVSLKAHFRAESDEALASQLGVAKSTIATWRRRGTIPPKAVRDLESRHGLTLRTLGSDNPEDLREHLLSRSFYFILLNVYGEVAANSDDGGSELAGNLAHLEPYLRRVLVRAASPDRYQGAVGAASFYLDLTQRRLSARSLAAEAIAEFEARHPGKNSR